MLKKISFVFSQTVQSSLNKLIGSWILKTADVYYQTITNPVSLSRTKRPLVALKRHECLLSYLKLSQQKRYFSNSFYN